MSTERMHSAVDVKLDSPVLRVPSVMKAVQAVLARDSAADARTSTPATGVTVVPS